METKEIKERPILFSGAMVTAIMRGSKTQTRRVVKPQPPKNIDASLFDWSGYGFFYDGLDEDGDCHDVFPDGDVGLQCPYGTNGDRLWVREAFAVVPSFDLLDDGAGTLIPCGDELAYRADGVRMIDHEEVKWKPSIHMWREASRLSLEIVGIRVERLNDITEEDARAEGVASVDVSSERALDEWCRRSTQIATQRGEVRPPVASNVGKFALLWDQINGKAHPWRSNPWVWVVEFKRVK